MRSSLIVALIGIPLIACSAGNSKSASSDWHCAPTAVHNGETVTCTASAVKPPSGSTGESTQDPQQPPTPSVGLRTYGVPAPDDAGAPASGGGGDTSDSSGSGADEGSHTNGGQPTGPTAPGEYDCSTGGESCPPKDALPAPPASSGGGAAAGGGGSGEVPSPYSEATDYRCQSGGGGDMTTCTRKTIQCKEGTMQVGQECLAPGEAPTTPPAAPAPAPAPGSADAGTTTTASVGCTLTQGYWKNHPTKWPTQVLTIGGVAYGETELLTILNTPPSGDASLILAHQLIASMLNAANGAGQTQVGSAIQAAQAWMAANKDADGRLPYGVASTSAAGTAAVSISSTLDTYNNGGLGVPHCN